MILKYKQSISDAKEFIRILKIAKENPEDIEFYIKYFERVIEAYEEAIRNWKK